ncbi:hypothetical protein [Pontibacter akesuensis]|uniref:Lipoprotein n=1 Tax=Pontibacter akesuensis TaxID=388950 RepID=A0A1I7JLC7_9BACT|nr:hypothetical protein [Pontibacter akesuensis]SFU85960.1 hypothetical protein SAMN04487941_2996 [Pontibacter akesuensis]
MMRNLLLFVTALFILSCSDSNSNLEEKLTTAITEGEVGPEGYKIIQMTELTDFEWDRMYYFQASEDKKEISAAIGFKWDGTTVPELSRRLLFVKDQEVVSFVDFNYNDFPLFVYGCEDDKWVYPNSRSQFASFKYCDGDREIYTFIPVKCIDNIKELMAYDCPAEGAVAAK